MICAVVILNVAVSETGDVLQAVGTRKVFRVG